MGACRIARVSWPESSEKWTWRELNPFACVYKTLAPNLAGPNDPAVSVVALHEMGVENLGIFGAFMVKLPSCFFSRKVW
jgi:hypothetical protein